MAGPIYKLWQAKFKEAWYQLSQEEQRQRLAQVEEALTQVGGKRVLLLQPRTQPNSESLPELAESIRQHGVLEPVIVRAIALTEYEGAGRRYELVASERRWPSATASRRSSCRTRPTTAR